ncbi:hypothetical protein GCM10010399_39960 [Dactylosporangium fulvum]|uniref:Uncharacterized protein n=1 Tax=Dactylosporangium fulvum TaxID=53359 RepID=A0ABY5VZ60_9ACTN|nr:hypothetical protein [Dactylosporangium fulvum]UWP82997.1 hypothetical protein Dfulv_01420 [Dactylosporangium fulvum]
MELVGFGLSGCQDQLDLGRFPWFRPQNVTKVNLPRSAARVRMGHSRAVLVDPALDEVDFGGEQPAAA